MSDQNSEVRLQARKIQEDLDKRDRKKSLLVRSGVVAVAVMVTGGITFSAVTSETTPVDDTIPDSGPAPASANTAGGFVYTSSVDVAEGDGLGTVQVDDADGTSDIAGNYDGVGAAPHMVIYSDPSCPHCRSFEEDNAENISEWLDNGDLTVEYRWVSYLNDDYSSRANNAIACMIEESPEDSLDYMHDVYDGSPGGGDDELISLAEDYADISECVTEGEYRPFDAYVTAEAELIDMPGTPTVYVDGENWHDSGEDFIEFVDNRL